MLKRLKRSLAIALAAFLIVSANPAVYGAQSKAAPGGQVSDEIGKWLLSSLSKGNSGKKLNPDAKIKRAEFFVLINQVLNLKVKTADKFSDVPKNAWYYDDLSKLVTAGIVQVGSKGQIKPEAYISRQEAAVIMSRAFNLTPANKGACNKFRDAKKMASWSKDAISALTEKGFVVGRTATVFGPSDTINYTEALKIITKVVGDVKRSEGKYTGKINSNLVVNTGNITLKGMSIAGDLYLTQGIGEGNVTLDGVSVKGKTYVNGGGENSIIIKNTTLDGMLIIRKYDGKIRVVASDNTKIFSVLLNSGAKLQSDNSESTAFEKVRIGSGIPSGQQVKLDGNFEEVSVESAKTDLYIIGGSIRKLEVKKDADNSTIKVEKEAIVKDFTVNSKISVYGSGKIENANVNVNGVTIEQTPDNIKTGEGVKVEFGGKPVPTPTPTAISATPSVPWNPPSSTPIPEYAATSIIFGDSGNEQKNNLLTKGYSGNTTIASSVGSLNDNYKVRYIYGKDSEISFDMFNIIPNKPLTLEVEEIHTRSDDVLAYTVLVNGQEQYFRTYDEASDGPNHYFVHVDAAVVGNKDTVRITFKNESGAHVNFSRVWAYSDFDKLLTKEKVYRPMTIGLFQPKLDWNDYQKDLNLLNSIKSEYSDYDMYKLGFGFDILYMHWSKEETKKRLDYLINLSKDTGIPVHLSVNSWWGGTPSGPDGKGGYWRDIPYNQVVYDPINVDGRGNWKLSTPNIWSNTPWLSMNNEHYNNVRAEKVKELTEYISERTAEFQADGIEIPPVVVFTENEPLYWPYFAFNASPDGAGDFSPEVIAAAARDEVTLYPSDGLTEQEKLWMFNNLNKYISTIGNAMNDGYGYNAVVVENGSISYPDYQLLENAYSHMFVNPNYPNWDENRAAWETHMVKDLRYGAEWQNKPEGHYLDYIAARGKFAYVNTERSMMTDFGKLLEAYVYGADHDTIYNYVDGDQNLARQFDGKKENEYNTPTYENSIFSYNFRGADSLDTNNNQILTEVNGVRREPLEGNYVICPDSGSAEGGQMTFKVENNGIPLSTGLTVVLEGRCLSSLSDNCRIEVWAGASQDQLSLVRTIKEFSTEKIDVSNFIDKTKSTAYFQVRLYSVGLPSALYSWSAIGTVRAQTPWGKDTGHLNGFNFNLKQMRERNLWISYRADVERMLANYLEKAGQDDTYREIMVQYQKSNYVTVYNMLTRALSEVLPAKYLVKGSGSLGKYPINLEVSDPAAKLHTTIYEYGNSIKIGFVSDSDTDVALALTRPAASYYVITSEGNGVYEIRAAQAGDPGAVGIVDGKIVFNLNVPKESGKQYPGSFEARYCAGNPNAVEGYIYFQSQDPAIGEYANYIGLKMSSNVEIKRGAEGATDEQLDTVPLDMLTDGDLLKLTLNGEGEVVAVKAYYGKVAGIITEVQPISITGELRNAGIKIMGTDDIEHTFDIGSECTFESPNVTGTNIFTARVENLGFKVGDQVTVVYSPYTYQGSGKRAVKIYETYDTMISETFEDADEGWRARVFSANNVKVSPLDTNYKNKVLIPENTTSPAALVWKLDSVDAFSNIAIEYSGRSIMGPNQSVKWFVSADNENWKAIGGIDGTVDEGNFTMARGISINSEVNGLNTVYIKCEISSSFESWGCLNDVKIKKKASIREIESAELTVDSDTVYTDEKVGLNLSALYDNGDIVNFMDAKVAYVFSEENILTVQNGVIKAVNPGVTQVDAYVSVGGKAVKTNSVTVTVLENQLGDIDVSAESGYISVSGTEAIFVEVYNSYDAEIDPDSCQIVYSSSNPEVAAVGQNGIITGVSLGTTSIKVSVTYKGVTIEKSVGITVARKRNIVQDDFQNYPDGQVSKENLGAYEVSNLQVELMDPAFPDKGLAGLLNPDDPNNPDWQNKLPGYLIYKLDSVDPQGFKKLVMSYSGRAITVGPWKGIISFYAGVNTDIQSMQKIGELSDNGDFTTIRTIDLTNEAKGLNSIYVRINIDSARYSWAFLNSICFEEYTTVPAGIYSAELTMASNTLLLGNNSKIGINAVLDDGNIADLSTGTITYSSENPEVASVDNAGNISGNSVGTSKIKAVITLNGKTVETPTVTVKVIDWDIIDNFKVELDKTEIVKGETAAINVKAYDSQGNEIDITGADINYSVNVEGVVSISGTGVVSAVEAGSVQIGATVNIAGNTGIAQQVTVSVVRPSTLLNETFEDGDASWQAKAESYDNIIVAPLDPNAFPDKGIYPPVQGASTGTITYRLDSTDPEGFRKLFLNITGRAIVGSSVVVYAGDEANSASEIVRISTAGFESPYLNSPATIDLSQVARGKNTIYLKLELNSGFESWACVTSINVLEYIAVP